jgi:hypothetical protein
VARLIGPDANSRLVYAVAGTRLQPAVGATAVVYSDAAGTVLADIAAYQPGNPGTPGAVISGSTVTVDATSQLPLFWFPASGADTLYVKVDGGPVTAINADYDSRLDTFSGTNYRGTWAPTTAYALNDLASLGGELLICTVAHTSGSSFSLTNWVNLTGRAGVYNVKLYGAKGDNATDDTAAINAAVTAAVAGGIADGSYTAEVYFPPATYVTSSATTKGGGTQGNAQIPLPVIPTTGRKFVLKFASVGDGTAFGHWEQTVGQRSGAVLRSTLTGQTPDGTWGPASAIGGPTVPIGSGVYTNLKLVIQNITVMLPYNPSFLGFDLRYLAQATIVSASALANAGVAGTPPVLPTLPTDSNGLALRMPQNGNNDCAIVIDFACEGFYYAVSIGEHFTAFRLALIYCQVGVFIGSVGGTSYHGASIVNLNIEATGIGIQCTSDPVGAFPLWVGTMSVETTSVRDFDDPSNGLMGWVGWNNVNNTPPAVNGAANLKIVSMNRGSKPGAATAPGMPSSTTPLTNPFWRDAAVTVTGGTVSAVSVDGQAQGFTATGFTVIVPSGKTITLTYSAGPAWHWTLL